MKTDDYMIVKGSEQALNVFERRVNSFINDGWEPLGGVVCINVATKVSFPDHDILYRQAMVRRLE